MRIAENLEMLEVKIPRGERVVKIYPTLTWDDKHLVLFDTGYPDTIENMAQAINEAGFEVNQITDIILTHQDVDHIGGANPLIDLTSRARIYAHEVDTPFIEGTKVPTKLDQLEQKKAAGPLNEADNAFYQMLKSGFSRSHFPVDERLKEGELLDFCGGIEVVFTPGHTPGHTSFYLQDSKIMVCGDAANISEKQIIGSNPKMTWDMATAERSLAKIEDYNPAGVISYHTGYLEL